MDNQLEIINLLNKRKVSMITVYTVFNNKSYKALRMYRVYNMDIHQSTSGKVKGIEPARRIPY